MNFPRNALASVCWVLLAFGSFNVVLSKRLCGEELNKVFKLLCDAFPTLHDDKRGMDAPFDFTSHVTSPSWEQMFEQYPSGDAASQSDPDASRFSDWFSHENAANAGREEQQNHFRGALGRAAMMRYRRNMAPWTHECCRRECSFKELLSYCRVVAPGIQESNVL